MKALESNRGVARIYGLIKWQTQAIGYATHTQANKTWLGDNGKPAENAHMCA